MPNDATPTSKTYCFSQRIPENIYGEDCTDPPARDAYHKAAQLRAMSRMLIAAQGTEMNIETGDDLEPFCEVMFQLADDLMYLVDLKRSVATN